MSDFPLKIDSLARARVEASEGWRDACAIAPLIRFPSSWSIQIIPPFCGAMMRFVVHKGGMTVSVYADYNEALGFFGEPHWEIYPGPSGENERFALHDTEAMMVAIRQSLAKQNKRQRGTAP